MKVKFITVFTALIATIFLLAGCTGWTNNNGNQEGQGTTVEKTRNTTDRNMTNRNITRSTRDGDFTNNVNDTRNNRNSNNTQDRYDVSKEAADRIVDEVTEIDRAYVVTTRNNAYVAAKLDENNTTPNDHLAKNDRNHNSTGTNIRNTNDRHVTDRTVNEGDANRRGSDNHISNRRDVEGHEVTDDVKNKIADIVQDVDNNIDNVYVSTSPDFFDLANNYADDMDQGKPVRGFFDQIGNTIERIFPQNKR